MKGIGQKTIYLFVAMIVIFASVAGCSGGSATETKPAASTSESAAAAPEKSRKQVPPRKPPASPQQRSELGFPERLSWIQQSEIWLPAVRPWPICMTL